MTTIFTSILTFLEAASHLNIGNRTNITQAPRNSGEANPSETHPLDPKKILTESMLSLYKFDFPGSDRQVETGRFGQLDVKESSVGVQPNWVVRGDFRSCEFQDIVRMRDNLTKFADFATSRV